MNDLTNDPAILSAITDAEDWRAAIEDIAEERGYFDALGSRHAALLTDIGTEVLLVSFEEAGAVRDRSARVPLGWTLTTKTDWSSLVLISEGQSWFRDPEVYGYFDRLADDGFFDEFERVIFLGAGPCGYAASAFSVAAPGAAVIALAPQATLAPERAGWDKRFPTARRCDFTSRYGYAPDMLEAAATAFVLHDPGTPEDAMHAALFARAPTQVIRTRRFGADLPAILEESRVLARIVSAAGAGRLTRHEILRALRARRRSSTWLHRFLAELEGSEHPRRVAALCRHVLAHGRAPRFKKALEEAEAEIARGAKTNRAAATESGPKSADHPALATL